jgi:hypothetical protein
MPQHFSHPVLHVAHSDGRVLSGCHERACADHRGGSRDPAALSGPSANCHPGQSRRNFTWRSLISGRRHCKTPWPACWRRTVPIHTKPEAARMASGVVLLPDVWKGDVAHAVVGIERHEERAVPDRDIPCYAGPPSSVSLRPSGPGSGQGAPNLDMPPWHCREARSLPRLTGVPRLRSRATPAMCASPRRSGSVRSKITTPYAARLSWTGCPWSGQPVG